MKKMLLTLLSLSLVGCASITNDAMVPISLSLSDGSNGLCKLDNKRGVWSANVPTTIYVRRSDDPLKYHCETSDGRRAFGGIPSTMGGKIVASAVFLDFGIVDAITDKHREYPASYAIPITREDAHENTRTDTANSGLE